MREFKIRVLAASAILAGLCITSPFPGAAAGPGAPPDISRTPAYYLLGALDLLQVAPREGLAVERMEGRPDGSRVARLTLGSKPPAVPSGARGLGILQIELANSDRVSLQSFDLLYNGEDRLIAVFPVFPGDIRDSEPQTAEKWDALQPRYFDLSPYYLEVPPSGAPDELEKWTAFAESQKKDLETIGRFIAENYGPVAAVCPGFLNRQFAFLLHESDAATGEWDGYGFNPQVFSRDPPAGAMLSNVSPLEFLQVFRKAKPGRRRASFPVFPTVYGHAKLTPDEAAYMRYVSKKFPLSPASKILVLGPGTGVDAWLASFRTREPVSVIGINPLEVANTEAAAKIAGFRVRAVIGDNAADEKGNLRFPGEKFDSVFWNMPAVRTTGFPAGHPPSLTDHWDGDAGGLVLARLAKALPGLLKPDGRALLWNYARYEGGRNKVTETLESAGTGKKVFEVKEERFLKRSLPREEFFSGQLYLLSRIR